MATLSIVAVALSAVCFASFAWSIGWLFDRPEAGTPGAMRWLGVAGIVCFAAQQACLFYPSPDARPMLQVAGLALYGAAFGLFLWTVPFARQAKLRVAFAPSAATAVVARGPYRILRHPFYASYGLFWMAGVLASQRWELLASVLVMSAFYAVAIVREEREFLAGPLASEYGAYRARTGAVFPRLLG